MNKAASTEIMKLLVPGSGALVLGPDYSGYIVNMHSFFSRSFLYYLASFGQTIGKKGESIVDIMTID